MDKVVEKDAAPNGAGIGRSMRNRSDDEDLDEDDETDLPSTRNAGAEPTDLGTVNEMNPHGGRVLLGRAGRI